MDKNLNDLRREIDIINNSILDQVNKRISLIKEIAELKDQNGIEYFDAERETEMMEQVLRNNNSPLCNELIKEIFSAIFSSSLKYMGLSSQKKLLISSASTECFSSIQEMFNLDSSDPVIIAGPCAVEKPEYLVTIAEFLNKKGLKFIRGGAYKPRTSPYDFQGLREEGLKILSDVSRRYGLHSITEVVDTRDVEMVSEYVDILQIGARNMYNFELLKEAGMANRPILLKRGLSATIDEFIFAAEYIALKGNRRMILCERGIRTYENKTRNTLDISAIPIIKQETNLPIMVDLSHSLGRKDIINSMAKSVLAAGADGIMAEVHPVPELALSDSKQQLNLDEFDAMLNIIKNYN